MNSKWLFFFIVSINAIEFCSYNDQDMGFLEKIEYKLWNNSDQSSLSSYRNSSENIEDDPQFDAIDCQTKVVNCCCITLSSIPFVLCITSFFIK